MLPFASVIAEKDYSNRFILESYFDGEFTHDTKSKVFYEWLVAVITCPTEDSKDILKNWHRVRNQNNNQNITSNASVQDNSVFCDKDISLANTLRTYWKNQE
jgi:hypothetical protein